MQGGDKNIGDLAIDEAARQLQSSKPGNYFAKKFRDTPK